MDYRTRGNEEGRTAISVQTVEESAEESIANQNPFV
jgi:hypothetical protein